MMRWGSLVLLTATAQAALSEDEVESRAENQGSEYITVNYVPYTAAEKKKYQTTLDPFVINMQLEYGRIDVHDDDRTIPESKRQTYPGWYFRPKIDAHTISLFKGDVIIMYVQI